MKNEVWKTIKWLKWRCILVLKTYPYKQTHIPEKRGLDKKYFTNNLIQSLILN